MDSVGRDDGGVVGETLHPSGGAGEGVEDAGVGVVVDSGPVAAGGVREDGSVPGGGCSWLNVMSVSVREEAVVGDFWIVLTPEVVAELVAEAEVAEGAGLGGDGDGVPGGDGGQEGHTTALEVSSQKGSSICRVP